MFFLENVPLISHEQYPNGCGTAYVLFHIRFAQTSTLFSDHRRLWFFSYSLKQFPIIQQSKNELVSFSFVEQTKPASSETLCYVKTALPNFRQYPISPLYIPKLRVKAAVSTRLRLFNPSCLKEFKRNLKPLAVYPTNPQMIKYN